MDMTDSPAEATFRADVRAFIKEHGKKYPAGAGRGGEEGDWPGSETMKAWRDAIIQKGWIAPHWPKEYGGAGLSAKEQFILNEEFAENGLSNVGGFGVMMIGPTLMVHGTEEQKTEHLTKILAGERNWAQGWSEPGAGSDLASLQTRAIRDGDEYVVNGQKIWTSGAHRADWIYMLARTDPDAPKHQGITWFAIGMLQPGVEIRPLKEMTGHAMFNEVFLTDAEVHDDDRIGDVNNGWAAANTTLLHERSGMGARGAGAGPETAYLTRMARAGTVAGDLDKRAGDFVTARRSSAKKDAAKTARKATSPAQPHIDLARELGAIDDPTIRQRIVQGHILLTLTRLNTERNKASTIPGIANLGKLLMGHVVRHNRDLGLAILGARGMLHSYDDETRGEMAKLPGGSAAVGVTAQALGAQALPIYGGTDQVQKNIVGERVLRLPKEPGDLAQLPFNQLPKNG